MAQTTRGERLKQALERWGNGVMAFEAAMKEELEGTDVKGATYPAVKRYLEDASTPSVEFLERAGRVLGVRPAWLAFGEGEATDEEEREARKFARRLRALQGVVWSPAGDEEPAPGMMVRARDFDSDRQIVVVIGIGKEALERPISLSTFQHTSESPSLRRAAEQLASACYREYEAITSEKED